MFGVLGKALEMDNERMAKLRMDEVFIVNMIDLLSLDNLAFV
jgi:hypothetical protein